MAGIHQQPATRRVPVIDVVHGIEVLDPYRWLEDQGSPSTREWLDEQNRYVRAYLGGISCRTRIRERVAELLPVEVVSEIWNAGNRYFFLDRKANAQQPVIVMREGLLGHDTTVIDPALRGSGTSTSVAIVAVSDDGRFLAYAVRQGGTDYSAVEIFDTRTNTVLRDRLPEGFGSAIVFARDGTGFYYSHRPLSSTRPNYRAVYCHRFGTEIATDREVFFAGEGSNLRLTILHSARAGLLAFIVSSVGKHKRTSLHLQRTQADSSPKVLLQDIEGCFTPFFVHDQLFACTDFAAPNRRIVRIDLRDPSPRNWRDVVSQSDRQIQQFAVVRNQIFVTRIDQFSMGIETFDLNGRPSSDIAFPPHGTITLLNQSNRSDQLFFSYTSIRKPATIYCHDAKKDNLIVWQSSRIPFDPSAISIEEHSYRSKDGTSIPLLLAFRKGLGRERLPTFLTGYGGFGSSATPRFSAFATFLIEQGFLFAVPALRGGSELGQQWHSAAQREKRQNSIDDFISAAEWLIANGRSLPTSIAIGGGSNAGLLVGAAVAQRPGLFRAAICLGPLFDMTRYHLFNFAAAWADEYGSPEEERDFKSLLAYSPYHSVRDNTPYPAVMLISGDADTRCNPMHARKMTARLQAANISQNPILLDYRSQWGHAPVQPLDMRIEALTNRLAFICHELSIQILPRRSE